MKTQAPAVKDADAETGGIGGLGRNREPGTVRPQSASRIAAMKAALGRLGRGLIDNVYPPGCLHCGAHLATSDTLCPACWARLRPISRPYCPVLGLPFEIDPGPEVRCAEAIAEPPPFDRARAAVIYDDLARALVSRLKFGDRTELARFCGRFMARAGTDLITPETILVPVPLHRTRQWRRRFNQAALLAEAMGAETGCRVDLFLAERIRGTQQQVGLSATQRARNVGGAFRARPDLVERTGGRPLLLVDDVITTGSTVKALTRVLKRAGAERIDVISFARVVTGAA